MAAMTFGQAIAKRKRRSPKMVKNHQQILPLFLRPSDTQTLIAMEHPPAWFEDVPSSQTSMASRGPASVSFSSHQPNASSEDSPDSSKSIRILKKNFKGHTESGHAPGLSIFHSFAGFRNSELAIVELLRPEPGVRAPCDLQRSCSSL